MGDSTSPDAAAPPRATRRRAPVREIFSSVQGEGVRVGRRQIFCRLEGCDLACPYCDTPAGFRTEEGKLPRTCRVETVPGTRRFETLANPVSVDEVGEKVARLERAWGPHDAVAITGGEPLVHDRFLAELLPGLREDAGLEVYLETAGHHPDAAGELAPWIDFASVDLKLPAGRDGNPPAEVWPAFLEAIGPTEAQLKVVVLRDLTDEGLRDGLRAVEGHEEVPLVLQPVTPFGEVTTSDVPPPDRLLALQRVALRAGWTDVRVIPQTHKMMDQL